MFITALTAIFITLLCIAFLSGIEVTFLTANRLSIEINRKQGTYSGKLWGRLSDAPTKFLAALLLAFNIALVIYGSLVDEMLTPLWEWLKIKIPVLSTDNIGYIKLLVETFLAALLLIFIEFAAKAFFRSRTSSITSNGIIASMVSFVNYLFTSAAGLFVKSSEWILKYLFNVKIPVRNELFNKGDLENLVQQSKGFLEEETSDTNKELFEKALSLGETRIRECLVPRKEIIGVDAGSSVDEVKAKFIETHLSKLVVYEDNIDNITGYVHQLDLFKAPQTLQEILLPIPTVPESMNATAMMNKFGKDRKSIAWVIDEFGGTAGIVTMEDLLEEIFGEIKDEYDEVEEFVEKQLAENEYIFSGRIELDHLTEKYNIHFSEDEEAETLSGFIIQHHEDIPQQNQKIYIGNYEFTILSVSGTRIETVKMRLLD